MSTVPTESAEITAEQTMNEECNEFTPSEDTLIDKVNQLKIQRNEATCVVNTQNKSLQALSVYASDSDESEMDEISYHWERAATLLNNRSLSPSSSSSSSSSSSEDEVVSDGGEEHSDTEHTQGAIRKTTPQVMKNEYEAELLPPVPDLSTLNLNTDTETFVHMGNVFGIVDKLVTVNAIPNSPAYDLDTLLFLDNGKVPLGFVFDVLGQVTSPIYAIRFNSIEDIKKLNIEIGAKVYSAPTSKHTQYVFLQQLLKMKGSDASWLGDQEVPPEFQDYSDDENECLQRHGNRRLQPHVKRRHFTTDDKHKRFEDTMNRRNTLNTKFNRYIDTFKRKPARPPPPVATFDPTVPPPNMRMHFPPTIAATPTTSTSLLPTELFGNFSGQQQQ